MLFTRLPILLLTAVLLPSFAEAGLFYKGSAVKMLDAKSFKKAMRENVRSVVVWSAVGLNPHLADVFCFLWIWVGGCVNSKRASWLLLRLGVGYVFLPLPSPSPGLSEEDDSHS